MIHWYLIGITAAVVALAMPCFGSIPSASDVWLLRKQLRIFASGVLVVLLIGVLTDNATRTSLSWMLLLALWNLNYPTYVGWVAAKRDVRQVLARERK
jgi:hypothetical protein